MKKVIVATDVPWWLRAKGNQQRIQALLDYLAGHFSVTVAYLGAGPAECDDARIDLVHLSRHDGLAALAWKIYATLPGRLQQALVRLLGRLNVQRSVSSFDNPRLAEQFAALCESGEYAAVIIEYIWHSDLISRLDASRQHLILDTHDIYHRRVEDYRRFGLAPDKTITREQELAIFARFDYLMAIQNVEFNYLERAFPGRAILAMHPVRPHPDIYQDRLSRRADGDRLTIVYFASYGDANLDAIHWFAESVWSDELAERFSLEIHGAICASVQIVEKGIRVCGRSPTIAAVYRNADIAINPQRFGSGLKIKTIEALSYGVPVVTTAVGAEGLEALDGKALLCGDEAEALRSQLKKLENTDLRQSLSAHALQFAARQLNPEACFGELRRRIETPPGITNEATAP